MAIVLSRREIKWFDRYWVQPGEVAVKIDGGQTRDADGTPNVYRAGNLIKPRIRLLSQSRKQEIVVFDSRRQPKPLRLEDVSFPLALQPLLITLSADVWFRIRDPLPLVEDISIGSDHDMRATILIHLRSAIEQVVREMPAQVFLENIQTLRDLLLRHPELVAQPVAVEDISLFNVRVPPELLELRSALEAHFAQNRSAVDALLDSGIVPTFDVMRAEFPSYVQELLATTQGLLQRIAGTDGSKKYVELGGLIADVWNRWLAAVQDGAELSAVEGIQFKSDPVADTRGDAVPSSGPANTGEMPAAEAEPKHTPHQT